jgi:adenylate kinase
MFVLAIVGLSGVGKSTLIGQFEKELPLRHFHSKRTHQVRTCVTRIPGRHL